MKLLSQAKHSRAVPVIIRAAVQLSGARTLGLAAGFVTTVLLARSLSPDAFGVYAFAYSLAALISQIPGVGLDMSAVRVSARYWATQPDYAWGVLVVAGAFKLCTSGVITILLVGFAGAFANNGLLRPELVGPLYYAAFSAFALALSDLANAMLQAQQRFASILVVNMLAAALKLAPVIVLFSNNWLSLNSGLHVFVGTAYAGAALGMVAVWRSWRGRVEWSRAAISELWRFSTWFLFATLLGTITSGLDALLLANLAGPSATGLYASSRTLVMPISVVGSAVGAVLLPYFGRLAAREPIGPYVRNISMWLAVAVAAVCALGVVLAPWLLPLVFGPRYASATAVFQLLVLAYGIQVVIWPVLTALMVLDQTKTIAALNGVMLAIVGIGCLIVVPALGAIGAAAVLLGAYIVILLCYFLALRRALGLFADSMAVEP